MERGFSELRTITVCAHTATMPSNNNKEKPWDTDDIDKWKVITTLEQFLKKSFPPD